MRQTKENGWQKEEIDNKRIFHEILERYHSIFQEFTRIMVKFMQKHGLLILIKF